MIWLIGQHGLLGREMGRQLTAAGLAWVGSGRDVDVTDPGALEAFSATLTSTPTWLVNCSAYTAVDKAEDDADACTRINVDGAEHLARLATKLGAALLHVSTDYVFDGKGIVGPDGQRRPYREDDPVAPQSVYGRTKADGEQRIRQQCRQHLILRTAWLYGADGPNFVFTMLRLMKSKDALGVVGDQWGSPTWTRDLAQAMVFALQHPGVEWGTYHASGEGLCSWFEFAQAIHHEATKNGLLDVDRRIALTRLTTDQYPTRARRPAWSVLSKDKLKRSLGWSMPHWRDSLEAFLTELAAEGNSRL